MTRTGVVSSPRDRPEGRQAVGEFAKGLASCQISGRNPGPRFRGRFGGAGAKSSDFFSVVYRILLGSERGPKLGPYIMDAGPAVIARKNQRSDRDHVVVNPDCN